MTDTTSHIADARKALAVAGAALDATESRISELEATIRQSAEAALAVANGKSVKPLGSTRNAPRTTEPQAERKPRQTRSRQPRGQAQQKAREAISSMPLPWTAADLAKAMGAKDVSSVYRHIRRFEEEGAIRKVDGEGSTQYYEAVPAVIPETNGAGDEAAVPALA